MPSMDGLRATRRIKAARSAKVIKLPRPWLLLALALSVASPASAQAPGTWAPIADLNQPRAEHTATLLANGTVLISGGRDAADQPLASAEIYDPATGGYTLLASPLPAPVWGHTATRLGDGTVLIAGGTGDGGLPVAAAQLFDPATDTFTALDPMSTPRARHTAPLLRAAPRPRPSAAFLRAGTVLVAGGQTTTSQDLDSAEVYDPAMNAFTRLTAPMGTARSGHLGVQLLHNGKVLISGGTSGGQLVPSAE